MTISNVNWLQQLLGFDAGEKGKEAGDLQLIWTNLPQSLYVFTLIFLVLAVAFFVIYFYRREIDTCSRRVKMFLASLRIAVLLVLVVVLLGPAVTYTTHIKEYASVVLMRDSSQSMNTHDLYLDDDIAQAVAKATGRSIDDVRETKPSRTQLVNEILERDDCKLLAELQRRGKLRIIDFSNRVISVETREHRSEKSTESESDPASPDGVKKSIADPLPELVATGQATDLYRAIEEGLSERMTAAIVILTDGQHTGKETGRDSLRSLAAKAKEKGVQLLIVGMGDPTRPRNLVVSDIYADPQVWKGDPFEIQAVLRAQGVGAQTVQVKLFEQKLVQGDEKPEEKEIDVKDVELPADGGTVRLSFNHIPNTAGRFAYTVKVQSIENEISTDDNQPKAPIEVKVLDEQARVLLIAGSPTWEYRGVQQLLSREKSVDLSCWLQTLDEGRAQEGNTTIEQLPYDKNELFKYDVIMMFDPNPNQSGMDQAWIELLKQFVSEHAGGVLYMAGPKFSGQFLSPNQHTSKIRDVLPVRLGDVQAIEVMQLLSTNTSAWPLGIIRANVDQPIMRFFPESDKTMARWKSFPGVFWSFPSKDVRPASRVLIEHSDPTLRQIEGSRPLLVTGQFGSGRTVFVGFNGTWRWRRVGVNGEFFNRFWIQTTRYLVEGRSLEGKRRGVIETDRFSYELGDRVTITAQFKDSSYNPLEEPEIKATVDISGSEKQPITFKKIPNQSGQYEATLTARRTGRHIISVELGSTEISPPKIETTFAVSLPSVETNRTWLDKSLLVEIAEASGGAYYNLDELEKVVAAIPDRTRDIAQQKKPRLIWDTNRVLMLLVILLSLEWAVRKHFKLL